MSSARLLASMLAVVWVASGQNDDAPVEDVYSPTHTWCAKDAHCQAYEGVSERDVNAVCKAGQCQCSTGFSHPTVGGELQYLCAPAAAAPGQFDTLRRTIWVILAFSRGDCLRMRRSTSLIVQLVRIINSVLRGEVLSWTDNCGSYYLAAEVEMENRDVARTADMGTEVMSRVAEDSELSSALGDEASFSVSTVEDAGCTSMANARRAVMLNGQCSVLTCEDGYHKEYLAASEVEVCRANPDAQDRGNGNNGNNGNSDGDDGLSDTELAIVIVACVLAACILLVLILFVCKCMSAKNEAGGEQVNRENPAGKLEQEEPQAETYAYSEDGKNPPYGSQGSPAYADDDREYDDVLV